LYIEPELEDSLFEGSWRWKNRDKVGDVAAKVVVRSLPEEKGGRAVNSPPPSPALLAIAHVWWPSAW
jgi:hypothetical protein